MLKEAAVNAAGPPTVPSSGGTTPMGVSTPADEGEQEMINNESVQNAGSQ